MTQTLAIIGVGAFGEFALPYILPYFDVHLYDAYRDLSDIANEKNVTVCSLEQAAACDVVILAVPVQAIEETAIAIAPYLKSHQLVMDVASVKCVPAEILERTLPSNVDIIGLHPLFGPQSGKNGIKGLNIALVNVRGDRDQGVHEFLSKTLELNVTQCTADAHDEQMAYVQGLTHMIAKVFMSMDLPAIDQPTQTFELLRAMVENVSGDSDELFRAIQTQNPYVDKTKGKFFAAVRALEAKLKL